jgi:AraC-like DNA-binding protein
MPLTSARVALASDAHEIGAQTRAWRPFPAEEADILCIEEANDNVEPRIHGRFSVTVMRSAAVVRCESSRSLVAARNCVLLVPASQLYSLRAQSRPSGATVTLLVGASNLNGLDVTDRAALVTDVALVEQVEALVTQLSHPAVSLKFAATMRGVLDELIASAEPVGSALPRQGTPLVAARDYLRAHSSEPVTIAELADMMTRGVPPHSCVPSRVRAPTARVSDAVAACSRVRAPRERLLSVSTVAFEAWFADQSHLSRNSRRCTACTPAAWASGGRHQRAAECAAGHAAVHCDCADAETSFARVDA